ncbi:hypothetical protein THRCLA_21209 [Thraustotheca clavata]|uniref:Uncharacterized protein n=1 Tax=Thraustotheca clavata TaxID=74557 RepID=A0A1V9ZYV7_9STRA|nr:hypothetical protein THRCLA_21209 [Thraustotheca clavata]
MDNSTSILTGCNPRKTTFCTDLLCYFTLLFKNLATLATIQLRPVKWNNSSLNFLGGNLMCTYNSPRTFVQESFAFDDICSTQLPLNSSLDSGMFACMMSTNIVDSLYRLPALAGDDATTCQSRLLWTHKVFIGSNITGVDINSSSLAQLGYMQFVSNNSVENIEM